MNHFHNFEWLYQKNDMWTEQIFLVLISTPAASKKIHAKRGDSQNTM